MFSKTQRTWKYIWVGHMDETAWEKSVDPLLINAVGLNSAPCNNLLLTFSSQPLSQ